MASTAFHGLKLNSTHFSLQIGLGYSHLQRWHMHMPPRISPTDQDPEKYPDVLNGKQRSVIHLEISHGDARKLVLTAGFSANRRCQKSHGVGEIELRGLTGRWFLWSYHGFCTSLFFTIQFNFCGKMMLFVKHVPTIFIQVLQSSKYQA